MIYIAGNLTALWLMGESLGTYSSQNLAATTVGRRRNDEWPGLNALSAHLTYEEPR